MSLNKRHDLFKNVCSKMCVRACDFLLVFVYNSLISPFFVHANGKASILCFSSVLLSHL